MAWLKGKQISKSHVKGGTTILDFQKKKKCVSLNTMREIRLYRIFTRRMLMIIKTVVLLVSFMSCLADRHAAYHLEEGKN